jgi:hypothetical protein
MSIESGGKGVYEIPKNAEDMIREHLSYQKIGTPEQKRNQFETVKSIRDAEKYADVLIDLAKKEGMKKLVDTAVEIKDAAKAVMNELNIETDKFFNDYSWAMWSLGKYYYEYRQRNAAANAGPASPNEAREMMEGIIGRRVAVEARKAYLRNKSKWKKYVDENTEQFNPVLDLLRKDRDDHRGLNDKEFTDLGKRLLAVSHAIQQQHSADSTHAAHASAAPGTPETTQGHEAGDGVHHEAENDEDHDDADHNENNDHGDGHDSRGHEKKKKAKKVDPATVSSIKAIESKIKTYDGEEKGVTPWKVVKAYWTAKPLFIGAALYYTAVELFKASKDSLKGMFDEIKKIAGGGFAALNKSPEGGGGGGHKPEKKKDDHGKKADQGHGGGHH